MSHWFCLVKHQNGETELVYSTMQYFIQITRNLITLKCVTTSHDKRLELENGRLILWNCKIFPTCLPIDTGSCFTFSVLISILTSALPPSCFPWLSVVEAVVVTTVVVVVEETMDVVCTGSAADWVFPVVQGALRTSDRVWGWLPWHPSSSLISVFTGCIAWELFAAATSWKCKL